MRALLVAISILIVGSAWAQNGPTIEQRMEETLGKLLFQNTVLAADRDRLAAENKALQSKLEEVEKKAKKKE